MRQKTEHYVYIIGILGGEELYGVDNQGVVYSLRSGGRVGWASMNKVYFDSPAPHRQAEQPACECDCPYCC